MSEFLIAHRETMGDEGGSSFNPNDTGNIVVNGAVTIPTYMGVAPRYWGNWHGFALIKQTVDSMPTKPAYGTEAFKVWHKALDSSLSQNATLQQHVLDFYKVNFWTPYRLAEILVQSVANWLYNHIVNGGARGVQWMQEAAGVAADGKIGPATLRAINSADPEALLQEATDVAAFYRLDRAADDPTQIQFLPSWLRRDGVSDGEIRQVMSMAKDGLSYTEVSALKRMIKATV